MTIRDAQLEVAKLGMVLSKTEHNEFRVNFKGGSEETAYYTNDLGDAVGTAKLMKERGPEGCKATRGAFRRQPSVNGNGMGRFAASQVLDRISDHLEGLGQAIPREASNFRGIALRLDRVANTLESEEGLPEKKQRMLFPLGAEEGPPKKKKRTKKLFMRPVFSVKPDGSEKLVSIAVCTTAGEVLEDRQIVEHFPPNTPGREIREYVAEFHPGYEVDWAESINAK